MSGRRFSAFFRRHRILRTILKLAIIPAALGIAFGLHVVASRFPETVRASELGFKPLNENAVPHVANYPNWYSWEGFSISADGQWLAMRVALDNPWGQGGLLFDLKKRCYLASLNGLAKDRRVDLILHADWTPDDLPVLWTRGDTQPPSRFRELIYRLLRRPLPSGRSTAFCLANVPASKVRLHFSEPWPNRDAGSHYAFPNRSRTAVYLFGSYWNQPGGGSQVMESRIYDLRRLKRDRARVLKSADDLKGTIGWLDDDRTLVFRSSKGLRLIDAWREDVVREVAIYEPLERLQREGKLGPGALWPFLGEWKKLPHDRFRFLLSLRTMSADREKHFDRLSLWDVDLHTGELSQVMGLDWCEPFLYRDPVFLAAPIVDFVCSSSGGRIVAPVSTSTLVTSSVGTSLTLAVASPGQLPRILPIRVPRFFSMNYMLNDLYLGDASPSPLCAHMAFLDENTLIYRGAGETLWRYDLRTSAPECLWAPWGRREEPAPVSGQLVDTRGRPVADRIVVLVNADSPRRSPVSPEKQLATSKTDWAGRFRFTGVSSGSLALEVQAYPGHGLYSAQRPKGGLFVLEPGKQATNLLCCVEAPEDRGNIAGRVLDADSGNPIEKFDCNISGVDLPGEITPVLGVGLIGRRVKPFGAPSHASDEFVGGRNGAFRIEGISPGTATLEISVPGYALEKVRLKIESGRTLERTFRLERESFLAGRIAINGKPCAYRFFSLRPAGDRSEAPFSTQSDANGWFAYRALKAGEYQLRVWGPIRTARPSANIIEFLRARVDSGTTTTLDFDFAHAGRTAAIRGRFSAPDRNHRWSVSVFDVSTTAAALLLDDRLRGSAFDIQTSGSYSIECLAPGRYEVVGSCLRKDQDRYRVVPSLVTTKALTLSDGETAVADFDLK